MNAEVVKAPLVLPERLGAVEVGQGIFFKQHPPWKRNLTLQPGGSLLVSTGGSIFASANVLKPHEAVLKQFHPAIIGLISQFIDSTSSPDIVDFLRKCIAQGQDILFPPRAAVPAKTRNSKPNTKHSMSRLSKAA